MSATFRRSNDSWVPSIHGIRLLVLLLLTPSTATAQSTTKPAAARTSWGTPDLRGVWDFRTMTPLQRPADLTGKPFLSDEEAAAYERGIHDRRERSGLSPGSVHALWWLDFGTQFTADNRTSLIIDPPNGLIPPLTPEAQVQHTGQLEQRPVRARQARGTSAHGPEDLGLGERCLLGFNSGPPIVPHAYNNNMQVFQTPDYVAVLTEMVHEVRIIPLDGRPHLPLSVRQWLGDSRGYWNGDTLVVVSTNFTDKTGSFDVSLNETYGSGHTLRLIERFTRLAEDALLYEFTVNDPTTFTSQFTAAVPMRRGNAPLYEYACHEGNYMMVNALSSARNQERVRTNNVAETR